ncbi:MAG TPA: hypothetical protein VIS99_06270, partial [Terrimicrobiaceae bacterium]
KTIQRRILLGTLLCAILLILGYLVFVGAPWGHQFDDYAYLGRGALSQKVVKLDSDILDLVSKASLVIAAMILFVIAAVRRCALVGAIR